jgi:hypothetical protein
VKRLLTVGFVAAALLSTMVITPGAQAAPTGGQSTSCSVVAKLKYRPPLKAGVNDFAFIKLFLKVRGCSGGLVTSADGFGGSSGTIRCKSGVVRGRVASKARLDWDTGDESGLNWFFEFNKSRLRGGVVGGLFDGERLFARFSLAPVRGLCEEGNPLLMSKLKGTLKL